MKCMHGWTGAILHIDLTDRRHLLEHPTLETYQTWIGGKGLAGHYLRPHVTRSWDIPEMPLIFMTGPLVGTASPTSGRMCVMSGSPLTGTVGEASVGRAGRHIPEFQAMSQKVKINSFDYIHQTWEFEKQDK